MRGTEVGLSSGHTIIFASLSEVFPQAPREDLCLDCLAVAVCVPIAYESLAADARMRRTERPTGEAAPSSSETTNRTAKRAPSTNASECTPTRAVSKEQRGGAAPPNATYDLRPSGSSEGQRRRHLDTPPERNATNASHTAGPSQATHQPQHSQVPRSRLHHREHPHSQPLQPPTPQYKQPLQPQPPQPQLQPPQLQPLQPPYAPPQPYPHVLHYGVPQQFMTAAHVAVAVAAAQAAVCPAPFVPHAPAASDAAQTADARRASAQPPLPLGERRCDEPSPAPLDASAGQSHIEAQTLPTATAGQDAGEDALAAERSDPPRQGSEHPKSPVLSSGAVVAAEAHAGGDARKLGVTMASAESLDVSSVESCHGPHDPSVVAVLSDPSSFHACAASAGNATHVVVQAPEDAPSAGAVRSLTQEESQLTAVAEVNCEQVVVGGTAVSFGHGPTASES
mmetsp:Transcript_23196/g.50737  ORF Transcript_23196/g.50737 Transcript_23196/m.50737 type:complete len:452 (+) Transcript_23196:1119-2474(+)